LLIETSLYYDEWSEKQQISIATTQWTCCNFLNSLSLTGTTGPVYKIYRDQSIYFYFFFQFTWNTSSVENLHRYILHGVVCKVVISVEPLYNFINYHNNQLLICYVFRISLPISVICAVHNEACLMQGSQ